MSGWPAGADDRVEPVGQRVDPARARRPRRGRRAAARRVASRTRERAGSRASVPTKTWCSWVTSATWPRRSSSGRSTSAHAADRRPSPVARRVDARRAAGRASTCRRRTGRPSRSARPARGRGRRRAARRGPRRRRTARPRRRCCSPSGSSPVASRSAGTVAIPRSRASDAAPTWSSSSQEMSRSTGSTSFCDVERRPRSPSPSEARPARDAASRPRAASPRPAARRRPRCREPAPCAGRACSAPRRRTLSMSASIRRTRSLRRPSASTVRAPSTVSAEGGVERRVRRALPQVAGRSALQVPARADESTGTPSEHGSAASGLDPDAATTVRTAVTRGDQRLRHAPSAPTARARRRRAVVRDTRSPVPARSTVDSGSASTRRTKSSRSSASTFSPRARTTRAARTRSGSSGRPAQTAEDQDELVDVPARRPVLRPSGRARRAAAAPASPATRGEPRAGRP